VATQQEGNTQLLERLLELRDPQQPARPLPRLLRRLLPDPLTSFEGWRRFVGEDLVDATPAAKHFEAMRIRTAAALVDDPERVPRWLLERLDRLAS